MTDIRKNQSEKLIVQTYQNQLVRVETHQHAKDDHSAEDRQCKDVLESSAVFD